MTKQINTSQKEILILRKNELVLKTDMNTNNNEINNYSKQTSIIDKNK